MGIGYNAINILIDLRQRGYVLPDCSVLDIGAQQLANNFMESTDQLARLAQLFGISEPPSFLRPKETFIVHGGQEHLDSFAPWAREFWTWLGCSYTAIDIDGSPGSFPLDLNFDSVPPEKTGAFDIVTNFGTSEHLINQFNAFKVIHDLTAPGGVMVHHLPAGGMLNHGFFNYNPKFFWMLSRENGYRFLHSDFTQTVDPYPIPRNIADVVGMTDPGSVDRINRYVAQDSNVIVVLQKTYDIAFVPPIDIPTGTAVENDSLKRRYWTAFEPAVFDRLRAEGKVYDGPRPRKS